MDQAGSLRGYPCVLCRKLKQLVLGRRLRNLWALACTLLLLALLYINNSVHPGDPPVRRSYTTSLGGLTTADRASVALATHRSSDPTHSDGSPGDDAREASAHHDTDPQNQESFFVIEAEGIVRVKEAPFSPEQTFDMGKLPENALEVLFVPQSVFEHKEFEADEEEIQIPKSILHMLIENAAEGNFQHKASWWPKITERLEMDKWQTWHDSRRHGTGEDFKDITPAVLVEKKGTNPMQAKTSEDAAPSVPKTILPKSVNVGVVSVGSIKSRSGSLPVTNPASNPAYSTSNDNRRDNPRDDPKINPVEKPSGSGQNDLAAKSQITRNSKDKVPTEAPFSTSPRPISPVEQETPVISSSVTLKPRKILDPKHVPKSKQPKVYKWNLGVRLSEGAGIVIDDVASAESLENMESVESLGMFPSNTKKYDAVSKDRNTEEALAARSKIKMPLTGDKAYSNRTATGDVQWERQLLLADMCRERKKVKHSLFDNHSIVDRESNLLYCPVENWASDFMFRFMYTLKKANGSADVASPFDAPRQAVSDQNFPRLHALRKHHGLKLDFDDNNFRLLVVQDPLSRLFSLYLHHLYVPNAHLWKKWGLRIVTKYRRLRYSQSLLCGHDVTFAEFLKYVIDTLSSSDPRFGSVSTLCSPCKDRFSFIGHTETFRSDFEVVLSALNISIANFSMDTLEGAIVWDHVSELTENAFESYESMKMCLSIQDVIDRLWNTLQWEGIISQDSKFTLGPKDTDSITPGIFLQTVDRVRKRFKSDVKSQQQRRQALASAVGGVATDDINKLVRIYSADFDLFGYSRPVV